MENWQWVVDIFTFIGIAVSIIIALIAIVWLTCFFVKLLVKTFGLRVGKSYDLMVEDINKKAEAKKERNEKKRSEKLAQKMEILNMKLESKARVHEMKKAKLEEKLDAKEAGAKTKLFGDGEVPEIKVSKPAQKKAEKAIEKTEIQSEEEEVLEEIVDIIDGDAQTIDIEKPEEVEEKEPASKKKTSKKK